MGIAECGMNPDVETRYIVSLQNFGSHPPLMQQFLNLMLTPQSSIKTWLL
ncbi:hypothetical protein NIES4106_51190 [Fischerella sp. NIES-4106]|jgi:hypothetical protein|nr:hypothetical protein NIES4106_51190 [Fischerella sp. NIES-4106]